jgi:hypothetical protein
MKKVFSSNEALSHVWASQSQEYGRANSMSFENGVLFSYSTAIAEIVTNGKSETLVIFNGNSYSNTTAKHNNLARAAIGYDAQNTVTLKFKHGFYGLKTLVCIMDSFDNLIKENEAEALEYIEKAKRARLNTGFYIQQAKRVFESIRKYAAFFEREYIAPVDFSQFNEMLEKAEAKRAEAETKARAKREAEAAIRKEKEKTHLEAWRRGENPPVYFETTALRINNEAGIIETTKRANIPLEHAIKAWPLLKKLHEAGRDITLDTHSIKLGVYEMRAFKNNNLIVGCHTIPFAEVQNIANQLGL